MFSVKILTLECLYYLLYKCHVVICLGVRCNIFSDIFVDLQKGTIIDIIDSIIR